MIVMFIISLITIFFLLLITILLFFEIKDLSKLANNLESKVYKLECPIKEYYVQFQTNDLIDRKTSIRKTREDLIDCRINTDELMDENNTIHKNIIKYKIVEVKNNG